MASRSYCETSEAGFPSVAKKNAKLVIFKTPKWRPKNCQSGVQTNVKVVPKILHRLVVEKIDHSLVEKIYHF